MVDTPSRGNIGSSLVTFITREILLSVIAAGEIAVADERKRYGVTSAIWVNMLSLGLGGCDTSVVRCDVSLGEWGINIVWQDFKDGG